MPPKAHAGGAREAAARDTHLRIKATCRRPCRALLLTLILGLGCSAPADAQLHGAAPRTQTAATSAADAAVAEAASRFDLPPQWIRAVIAVESNGNARAVSPRGARGLMQIIPKTWRGLRQRYGLGADPFDVRDNILGGTAYLRELYERFGPLGFLAAYNAGPARYQDHLTTGRPLAGETRAYLGKLAGKLPELGLAPLPLASSDRPDWHRSALFTVRSPVRTPGDLVPSAMDSLDTANDRQPAAVSRLVPLSGGLFAPLEEVATR